MRNERFVLDSLLASPEHLTFGCQPGMYKLLQVLLFALAAQNQSCRLLHALKSFYELLRQIVLGFRPQEACIGS